MNNFRMFLFTIVLLTSPSCEKTENGPDQSEPAVVDDVILSPSQHGSGSGLGVSLDGKGTVVSTFESIDIPEKYAVVFRCAHGRFVIQGDGDSVAHSIWTRGYPKGQPVSIIYREVYVVSKGTKHLRDYWFVDALPRKP